MAGIRCANCGRLLSPQQSNAPCPDCGSRDRNVADEDSFRCSETASKDEVRKKLARAHYASEPAITDIFTVCADPANEGLPEEPIKLLEVNPNTIPTGIMPLGFDPSPAGGIPFPSVIIEVTPEEFERIRRRELDLPDGWQLGPLVPRTEPAGGEK